MSALMNTEVDDALVEAGASEEKARAAAKSVGDTNQLATKADIARLEAKMDNSFGWIKWVIGGLLVLHIATLSLMFSLIR